MSDTIITGAYDMHIHTGPDIMDRKLDFLEEAERVRDAGMAGYVIKKPLLSEFFMGKGSKCKSSGMSDFWKYCT